MVIGDHLSYFSVMGSMTPFPDEELRRSYGTPENYLALYRKGVDELLAGAWILAADGERMLAKAAGVNF